MMVCTLELQLSCHLSIDMSTLSSYNMSCLQIDGAVMVEDTSLCFNAYKGLPGLAVPLFPVAG